MVEKGSGRERRAADHDRGKYATRRLPNIAVVPKRLLTYHPVGGSRNNRCKKVLLFSIVLGTVGGMYHVRYMTRLTVYSVG